MLNNINFADKAQDSLACIFAISGMEISAAEKSLFKSSNPFGFVLFKRNCDSPNQVKSLVADLKSIVGRDCPILIDQEGGRVQRLGPPHWRKYDPMKFFGDLYSDNPDKALEGLRFETLRLAGDLVEMGINVNCAPVLDLSFDGAHEIIGDRAFSSDHDVVARLGLSVCRHFLKSGVTPIIKHIPGHGRARADSHLELPHVDALYKDLSARDFEPFRQISASDVGRNVWAMTAHIIFEDIDTHMPVSISNRAVEDVIRKDIGFDGVLICDDLDMKALDAYGSVSERALASLEAGCDLALYCAGDISKMEELAQNLPKISENTIKRLQNTCFGEGVVV